jgi:hypothetical protein
MCIFFKRGTQLQKIRPCCRCADRFWPPRANTTAVLRAPLCLSVCGGLHTRTHAYLLRRKGKADTVRYLPESRYPHVRLAQAAAQAQHPASIIHPFNFSVISCSAPEEMESCGPWAATGTSEERDPELTFSMDWATLC